MSIPELARIPSKIFIEQNLHLKTVEWFSNSTLGFTLSNGESGKAGSKHKVNRSYTFEPNKKITRVEVIIHDNENDIIRINFYSGQETLVKVGWSNDDAVKKYGERRESFEIADK